MSCIDDLVTVKLLFFAKARELIGKKELLDKVPRNITGNNLLNLICKRYELDRLKCHVILALNENWLDLNSDLVLKEADEVAIIPPLSGEFGAVSIFVGTTRDNFNGKTVTKLEYEAYEQMALKSLKNLCQRIRDKFDVGNIAIYHRLGDVPIQEASVVIAISSVHRQSALNSVPFAIDALKADVPIWKKEIYSDHQSPTWKENSESKEIFFETKPSHCQGVHLYEEVVETDIENDVPPHLIQVKADLQEINRRINSFIHMKRQQINMNNIKNFLANDHEKTDESTCARVSAILKRPKGSMSHLKVHRVANAMGPQTHKAEPLSLTSELDYIWASSTCPPGAEERLTNAENYLNITERSRNVFSRLKAIEDKIIFLESISPEYFDLGKQEQKNYKPFDRNISASKKIYSTSELDVKLKELEAKLYKKKKN